MEPNLDELVSQAQELAIWHTQLKDDLHRQLPIATPSITTFSTAKKSIAAARNSLSQSRRDLQAKLKAFEEVVEAKRNALIATVADLSATVSRAEEMIWTINLYTGQNEQIVQLCDGEPADATTKIALRQLVLYMDEECSLNAGEGGIDVEDIKNFDTWLLDDPKHLNQLLPEPKGIVALHIRRNPKDYEDAWKSFSLDKPNQCWTYFLVRNGDRLHRIYVDIDVGKHLFPTAAEGEEFFRDSWDRSKILKPGSDAYLDALDNADAKKRHYLRVLLILQGLIDRTDMFKPMPVDRINVCDHQGSLDYLQFIYDAENALVDEHPKFDDWLSSINAKLDVGQRIVGIFDYESQIRETEYNPGRVHPRTASVPDSYALHTIGRREGTRFYFTYDRAGDYIYRYGGGHDAKGKANCFICRDDDFIINYDQATVADMTYYLNSRRNRHHYQRMMPILQAAIALKNQESKDEAPFRALLVGEIIKDAGAPQVEIELVIDSLISWWKFKTKTHRALLSDDRKALRMIVAEFNLRQHQADHAAKLNIYRQTIIDSILLEYPDALIIAHQRDNRFVALIPHNGWHDFVQEVIYTYNQTAGLRRIKIKDWQLVDHRSQRWDIIHQSPRWSKWRVKPAFAMTDPEIGTAITNALATFKKSRDDRKEEQPRCLPLAALHDDDYHIVIWLSRTHPRLPNDDLIWSQSTDKPAITKLTITCRRHKGEIKTSVRDSSDYAYDPDAPPWIIDYFGRPIKMRSYQIWPTNVAQVAQEFATVTTIEERINDLDEKCQYLFNLVVKKIRKPALIMAYRAYLEAGKDPTKWPDEYKKIKGQFDDCGIIKDAVGLCLERKISVGGMMLDELFAKAKKFGLLKKDDDRPSHRRYFGLKIPDVDMAIQLMRT